MRHDLQFLKGYKTYCTIFILYLAISLAMFWNVSISPTSSVPNGGADVYRGLWNLWWVPYSIFTLHKSPYISNYLFYPAGANLVSGAMSPLAGILTAPVQALAGLAFTYNLIFFLGFSLSGLFMFMLARYLVKNDYAAFLAGLIFAFSPMHIAQSYFHLQWATIEFIPLFVLFFLMMLRERKTRYAVYSAISFVFLAFAGDLNQAAIISSFAILSILFFLAVDRKSILNRKTAVNFGVLAISVLALGSPFFISMALARGPTSSTPSQLFNTAHNVIYSDNLASFFLPSYYNGIFHNASLGYLVQVYGTKYHGIAYTPDLTEKVSYMGYSVLFLAALALYYEHKKNRVHNSLYWAAVLLVFVLLALGPDIQIGGISTGIPSLYSAYKILPLFNTVNRPGRFDIIATLALAVLAAIGFDHLSKSKYNLGSPLALALLFAVIILIEYNGMPFSSASARMMTAPAGIPPQYGAIAGIAGNLSVLVLPALPNLTTGSFLYPGMSMYYQTAFKRPIVGGYAAVTNSTQQQLVENIPLAVSASYLQNGEGMVYPYPINEAYSNLTLFWLASYRVGAVSVINSAYTPGELASLQSYLYSLFGNPAYINANVTIYSTAGIEGIVGGRSLVSYISGTWIPGYAFCNYSLPCSSNFSASWWGSRIRAVSVYNPEASNESVKFNAYSYYGPRRLYVYLNSNSTPAAEVNLSLTQSTDEFRITLPRGFSQIAFYMPNTTSSSGQNQYLNFGISNLTISSI